MTTVYDIPAKEFIDAVAKKLENDNAIEIPKENIFSRTGVHKENPPIEKNWWHIRCASILRKIYFYGPIGVSKLRIAYGGRNRRGVKPEHFAKGSGAVIRKLLQQLEKSEYIQKKEGHGAKGRVITGRIMTPKGHSFIDKIAAEIKRLIPELEKY